MSEAESEKMWLRISERDHAIGPTEAPVIVVNYGDYQCFDCHKRHRTVQKMIDELLGTVRFAYRHFPLVNVHPRALRAAEAAEAAAAQGKFWEMHRSLYLDPEKLEDRHLRHYAHAIGLDVQKFDQEMANHTYADTVLKDYYDSINNGVTGAPTTFINGELYAMSGVELIAAVKTKLNTQTSPPV
jgi:protein-disulfide isomerase